MESTSGGRTQPSNPAPPSDLSPLTPANALGRLVLVARETWPSYDCDENDGLGWSAIVKSANSTYAKLGFLHATTDRGLPYADAELTFDVLKPL